MKIPFYTKEHVTRDNIFPQKYVNKIICNDSYQILEKLPNNCIDCILTSPQYNFNNNYDTTNDLINWQQYFGNLYRIYIECIRILKYGGRFIIIVQPNFLEYVPTHHIYSTFLMSHGLI